MPRHNKFVVSGPIFRGRAIPYGLGVRIQRTLLALPGVRSHLFRREVDVLKRWGERIGQPTGEAEIRQSLLANTWRKWRSQVLAAPLGASPWVQITGDPALWQPRRQRPGRIFLVMHTSLTDLFIRSCQASGLDPLFIPLRTGETETSDQDRSLLIQQAYQMLCQGGTVIIAGDGVKGKQGVTVPFLGGRRLFVQGGAELAARTGAQLVPVFATLAPNSQVQFELCAPLTASEGTIQAQARELTLAYANLVTARWPQVYVTLNWEFLAIWLQRLNEGD